MKRYTTHTPRVISVAAMVLESPLNATGWHVVNELHLQRTLGYDDRTMQQAWKDLADMGALRKTRLLGYDRQAQVVATHPFWALVNAYMDLWEDADAPAPSPTPSQAHGVQLTLV